MQPVEVYPSIAEDQPAPQPQATTAPTPSEQPIWPRIRYVLLSIIALAGFGVAIERHHTLTAKVTEWKIKAMTYMAQRMATA